MPKFVYRFTGEVAELFPSLPASPPSRWLEPGQEVVCSAEVEHPRLALQESKPKPAPAAQPSDDTASTKEA